MILDAEINRADAFRRRSVEVGTGTVTTEINRYMRRLRRMLREVQRTRQELGWDAIELSDLAQRP
jgi:hypothetical protein